VLQVADRVASAVSRLEGLDLAAGPELRAEAFCLREVIVVQGVLGPVVAPDVALAD
jgi:hypothetical protein